MPISYALLLCVDYQDPSEVLNLIDDLRTQLANLPTDDQTRIEATCASAELEVHTRFTPMALWALAAAG
jgi:hypothetical protein